MAAISMNPSLRELAEQALLITNMFTDESDLQTLKEDIESDYLSVRSMQTLKRALVEIKKEASLQSYTVGSKITFPSFKPVLPQVCFYFPFWEFDVAATAFHLRCKEFFLSKEFNQPFDN